jgi:siroheme synthase, N-terminal domain
VVNIYYPLMINIKDKPVAIIGGGKVGYRKAKKLLEFGALVRIVSPKLVEEFIDLKTSFNSKLEIVEDTYKEEYIRGCLLVIAATEHNEINKNIGNYCRENGILCNVVDDMDLSDFIVPSTLKRGDLLISISTMGKSPALSAKIKRELEEKYSSEYEEYVELLGKLREIILKNICDENEKVRLLKAIIDMDIKKLQDSYEVLLKSGERGKENEGNCWV